ncbi:DUF5615 family PIN-like protein [Rubellimicrobium mesophilum]|uniref:DUF5615 family PIN-like protein n=1 Tax=Rubellimicrobium mesophilum TaxID=1123067 RepID=UPI00146FCFE4|nr:DUF5615 family PIN-like protein [Rubellimicrobium mesophilum]
MKFLIDECLAVSLADMAIEAGHPESAHVVRRGLQGHKDPEIMEHVLDGDWTLVTRNSDDFRPPAGSSSARPCYVGVALHAGLVCLNLPAGAREPDHGSVAQIPWDSPCRLTGLVAGHDQACPSDLPHDELV